MRLFKQLVGVFVVLGVLVGALMILSYDVIKIQWVSFMGLQPSYGTQEYEIKTGEGPLPIPARSIPIEGPAYIAGDGAPNNPVVADKVSLARGKQLFTTNCQMCHGDAGLGDGPISAFLIKKKPANLSGALVQSQPDGALFMTISNGLGYMPAMNENFTVRERWDLVNYVRTLKAAGQ
jgi:mono/diheme cytochrome c family protein